MDCFALFSQQDIGLFPQSNVSLLLHFSPALILMPQWNCDNPHYV